MNRIELALRQFARMQPVPRADWTRFPAHEIEVWLQNDVLAIVADFSRRPAFREHATWPLRVLVPGVDTSERRAVDAVDAALVTSAKCLIQLTRNKLVARQIQAKNPAKPINRAAVTPEDGGIVDEAPILQNQVRQIADRPWIDLVCADDYFYPHSGMNRRERGKLQDGMFVVAFNPELGTSGDFITRSLLWRVKLYTDALEEYRRLCLGALKDLKMYARQVQAEDESWSSLLARVAELQTLCTEVPDVSLRDSCIILTQLYADFHPSPDLTWLGLQDWAISVGAGLLRQRIRNQRSSATVDRIAMAVQDLNRLYPAGYSEKSALDEAVATGGLVLTEAPRSVYWETKLIDEDWARYEKPWRLLRSLASKAQLRAEVKVGDVYDDQAVGDSALSTLFGRLKNLLPSGLWKLMEATGRRSYRLQLERGRIHFLKKG